MKELLDRYAVEITTFLGVYSWIVVFVIQLERI